MYFLQKKSLIFTTYFLQLVLFCVKLFSPSEIIFTNDEHVFLRILVTNLRVLCFDIYAIPTMCTPYYQSRLNLASEILPCEHTHLFGMRCHCYILVGIINWQFQLKYVDIVISNVFNLNKHFSLFFSCCSHAQVSGWTLLHEFYFFCRRTVWNLLGSFGIIFVCY